MFWRQKRCIGSCNKCGDRIFKDDHFAPWPTKYYGMLKICWVCILKILESYRKLECSHSDTPCSYCDEMLKDCDDCLYSDMWKFLCIDFEDRPRDTPPKEQPK